MEDKKMQIPEGWIKPEFGKLAIFTTGKKDVNEGNDEGLYPFYTCSKSISHSDNFSFDKEALMIAGNGDVGTVHYFKGKFEAYQRTYVLSDFSIDVKYLFQYLKAKLVPHLLKEQSGTTIQFIKIGQLTGFEILLPKSLTEQKKIAEILSKVDTAIEQTQNLITKYQRIKTGLMQDLLTKGIDENGNIRSEKTHEFKDSELGRIPKEWDVEKLERCCSIIQDGTHFSPKTDKNGKYKYLTSKNIRFGYMNLKNIEYLNEGAHSVIYKSCPVKLGDVLLTKDGANTGNICINTLPEEFSLLSSVAMLRGKKNYLINDFIVQFFMEEKGQKSLVDQMSGNAITRITLTKINNTLISIPESTEQKTIVKTLKKKDNLVSNEKIRLQKLQSLKTALMQDLLSGKKRVNSLIMNGEL